MKIIWLLRIIATLESYRDYKSDQIIEIQLVKLFGNLLNKNQKQFEKLGFRYVNDNQIIGNEYNIHLTRKSPGEEIFKFLIRKSKNGQLLKPDMVYFSEKYPQSAMRDIHYPDILDEFISYLRKKISKYLLKRSFSH